MDFLTWIIVGSIGIYVLQGMEHRRRVRLLGAHLAPTQVEKLMGGLIEGYMRALDEKEPERRQQVWAILDNSEKTLADQLQRLADSFAQENAQDTRVSTLPLALPYFDRLVPAHTFDMREALRMHARAVRDACAPDGVDPATRKRMAFTMTAELLLLQHTCHWFCKTRTIASMRLMARQKTTYEQVLQSVSRNTLAAYKKLVGTV
ncbi:hypothetical protein [Comamonas aquatica]|uniref:hypothetical protein n=1 Tax=Comamonas aquatica TaxID=225991 RepID=UPI0005EC4614|nr:hypothetical protein [Comamonas aquatica]ANY61320.1 hypothetical protein MA05_03455 [Comamonas aquatica]MDH0199721.1 hypothetical protein [Comamonas aquatica]MDH1444950.1 hypothetical protein [Comamonas aquatica]